MTIETAGKPVLICDSQPVAIHGLRFMLEGCEDLHFAGAVSSLDRVFELAQSLNPAAIVLDKGLGATAVMDWLRQAATLGLEFAPVVWGAGINEPEALRFLQAGARGILRRTAEADTMLTCLRAVTSGTTWMEDGIFGSAGVIMRPRRSHLTAREQQIAELVERGLRNRDIARTLGIQTGTVKIHLKHIFEKTGVRGRYGLALTGLREKGTLPTPPPAIPEPVHLTPM
jgi:DNA-binding NarL/FixJ family response regulator